MLTQKTAFWQVEWPIVVKVHRADLMYRPVSDQPWVMFAFTPAQMEPVQDGYADGDEDGNTGMIVGIVIVLMIVVVLALA